LRRFAFDPARSRAILQDLGWSPGSDGMLRHSSDGRVFRNTISTVATGRLWEVATYADAWRRIGIEVEELQVPAAQARSLEDRASYPSWEATSSGQGDSILGRLTGPAASAENRWAGNRGGYEEPATQLLLGRYFSGLTEREQFQAMHELSDLIATELPMLIFYYSRHQLGVRKGVRALDDIAGGQQSSRPYGTYSRNAHLWDLE
jgi:ABC-type transport system substrate-binding protein